MVAIPETVRLVVEARLLTVRFVVEAWKIVAKPETNRLVVEAVVETVSAVVEAYGKVEALVPVAVKMLATTPLAPTTDNAA